jgi:6-pyruvoyltetrahydropterin/6-carboxytetrahydropterin synthase
MQYTEITKRFGEFPFAHRQPKHDGHCHLIHGHNWNFDITFRAANGKLDENDFVIDFGKMKTLKELLAGMFDHTLVVLKDDPELEYLREGERRGVAKLTVVDSGSAEALAKLVFEYATHWLINIKKLPDVYVVRVTAWEDTKNSATYAEE